MIEDVKEVQPKCTTIRDSDTFQDKKKKQIKSGSFFFCVDRWVSRRETGEESMH